LREAFARHVRCARRRHPATTTRSSGVFGTRRKQSYAGGWARTPTRRRTQRGAHSRSRTRSHLPSAQTELDPHFRVGRSTFAYRRLHLHQQAICSAMRFASRPTPPTVCELNA
jgi:hypothetical protein